ncbi:MAG: anaerobic ribonucleoside-triphosphate reductase activating protein [Prevotellaceae bacterium]|jgi:anaerobic ribonucleoside-triphosphate reductase activating protein|nr:anaerobic ribonucleoside-triphosphate reductase activating protein [Prevotellaceae bacterium]
MLKYHSHDIVFQEIPNETTLAINITNCPNRCAGCHSQHLQQDTGEELTENVLSALLEKYGNAVTCVCFMGGDNEPKEVLRLAGFVKNIPFYKKMECLKIKTAWYSGKPAVFSGAEQIFDYIKIGAYVEKSGGLNSVTTNQRLYKIENENLIDITEKMRKKDFF